MFNSKLWSNNHKLGKKCKHTTLSGLCVFDVIQIYREKWLNIGKRQMINQWQVCITWQNHLSLFKWQLYIFVNFFIGNINWKWMKSLSQNRQKTKPKIHYKRINTTENAHTNRFVCNRVQKRWCHNKLFFCISEFWISCIGGAWWKTSTAQIWWESVHGGAKIWPHEYILSHWNQCKLIWFQTFKNQANLHSFQWG